MRRPLTPALGLGALFLAALLASRLAAQADAGVPVAPGPVRAALPHGARYAPGVVLVTFQPGASEARRVQSARRFDLELAPGRRSPYFSRLCLSQRALAAGATVEATVTALQQDPAV